MTEDIESLRITINEDERDVPYLLEVRNLEIGLTVLISKSADDPRSLEEIELPAQCKYVEVTKEGISDICCPRSKELVTDIMILIIQKMLDDGNKIKSIELVEKMQDMIDFPKIVEAHNRNNDILFN